MSSICRMFAVIFAAGTAGCSLLQHDMTSDPVVKNIANQCFSIQKDSLVYETNCGRLNYDLTSLSSRCLSVQALGEPCLPETKEQFESDPKYWERKMYRCESAGRKIGQGVILAGTHLRVTRVLTTPGPEFHQFWNIKAVIESGAFVGRELFLPLFPAGSVLGPGWFYPALVQPSEETIVPEPDPQFLVRCD